ncbi:toll/interleukin-1 receptor domain-containing protein [Streptomyces parvus]|uniref:toll/interleukin-1 receptor domain-containing protein n=1 Tax=Streptomyces parvus TaxID=66428 RepID=UPI0033A44A12
MRRADAHAHHCTVASDRQSQGRRLRPPRVNCRADMRRSGVGVCPKRARLFPVAPAAIWHGNDRQTAGTCRQPRVMSNRAGSRGRVDYRVVMSRCTAPRQGHRTASGRAACPACSGGGYGYSSPRSYYPPPTYTSRNSGGSTATSGGSSSSGRTRAPWSPSTSSVTYTASEVKGLTPVRDAAVLRASQQPDLRDVFLCHAWDDRRGAAKELCGLLEAEGVSVWFSEKDIAYGLPFMREIDRGLAKGCPVTREAACQRPVRPV